MYSTLKDWYSDEEDSEARYNPPKYPECNGNIKKYLQDFIISTQDLLECGTSKSKGNCEKTPNSQCACGKCLKLIGANESQIVCNGKCENSFHIKCVDISQQELKKILSMKEKILWLCDNCKSFVKSSKTDNSTTIHNMKNMALIMEILLNLEQKIENIPLKINENEPKLTYASVTNRSIPIDNLITSSTINNHGIIIKPKNSTQTITQTNQEIQTKIIPSLAKAPVKSYKNTKKGYVIIKTESKEANKNLMDIMKTKLEEKYEVDLIKQNKPRIAFLGLKRNYENHELLEEIRNLNYNVDEDDWFDIKYSRQSKFTKKWIIYAETNGRTYRKLVNREINIGWGQCKVVEDHNILKCYRCCGFGHKTSNCTNKEEICSFCAGNHSVNKCSKNTKPKCINCFFDKSKNNKEINFMHPSDDKECPIFSRKIQICREHTDYSE
ncbi:unnamed protein product [Phaedon cochleariae]|uniref:PHD-type domain-containing protein n=1 Tax=Phaedon cochleariae TaxID=80249 RepID=A0A9P0DMN9_PHACE|nr:unnamed protein product [Phaedon cochleariae]